MMDNKFFQGLQEKIQPYFETGGSHEFSHTQRVLDMAIKIAAEEKADLDVVKAAALLHDIAREKEDNGEIECHAEHGAKLAKEILEELNFPLEKIDKVVHAIEVHRHSKGLKPNSKEAEIIQDADRLDALGAITIARMFATGGKKNLPMYYPDSNLEGLRPYKGDYSTTIGGFNKKILKITPDKFNTKTAREIAQGRYKFVEEFLDRFKKEWVGEL